MFFSFFKFHKLNHLNLLFDGFFSFLDENYFLGKYTFLTTGPVFTKLFRFRIRIKLKFQN